MTSFVGIIQRQQWFQPNFKHSAFSTPPNPVAKKPFFQPYTPDSITEAAWLDKLDGNDDPWSPTVQSFVEDMKATAQDAIACFLSQTSRLSSDWNDHVWSEYPRCDLFL